MNANAKELILRLTDPGLDKVSDVQNAICQARLVLYSGAMVEQQYSDVFAFTSPVGKLEQSEINWYLRKYHKWPFDAFASRGNSIESNLKVWGGRLLEAICPNVSAKNLLSAWLQMEGDKLFTVQLDTTLLNDANSRSAASQLMQIPWELLGDERGYLIHEKKSALRRQNSRGFIPFAPEKPQQEKVPRPIRILLVSPRPTMNSAGQIIDFIDHRSSALPLIEAIERLAPADASPQGKMHLEIAWPPTIEGVKACLQRAQREKRPFTIFHFDGHGIFDPRSGKGTLCFEAQSDSYAQQQRIVDYVYADKLASMLRPFDIPLVFLDACETAVSNGDPGGSVAGALLEQGVNNVVAMNNQVLMDSASRFVARFYESLALGCTAVESVSQAQRDLFRSPVTISQQGQKSIWLQDWFIASLFQGTDDNILFTGNAELYHAALRNLPTAEVREIPFEGLCDFVGRSQELLTIERRLKEHRIVTLLGGGGYGKTALASEVGDWLLRTGVYKQLLFVDLDNDANLSIAGFFNALGNPLSSDFTAALYRDDISGATAKITELIGDNATLIILDNAESVLLDGVGQEVDASFIQQFIANSQLTCEKLDFLLTSRQIISEDFCVCPISRMNPEDAELLVKTMLETLGKTSQPKIVGDINKVRELIDILDGHPRAILLVLKHLGENIDDTQTSLEQIFTSLDIRFPDDRQRSLYASIELSLRTLPADVREGIQALAVCQRGINIDSFASFTGLSLAMVRDCFEELVDCHIASWDQYHYLQLDPALSFYLKSQLPAQQVQALQKDWASEMEKLTDSLFNDVFKNSQRTFVLTRLELPNLLAYMDWMEKLLSSDASVDADKVVADKVMADKDEAVAESLLAEKIVNICTKLEPLIALLDNNRVLTRLESLRNLAGETLNSWSHARFEHERMSVERLHQRGLFGEAITKARLLLELTQAEQNRRKEDKELDQNVLPDEDFQFDLAMAHELVGNTLRLMGETDEALDYLQQGRKLFSNAGERGERMAFACAMIEGVCYASKFATLQLSQHNQIVRGRLIIGVYS